MRLKDAKLEEGIKTYRAQYERDTARYIAGLARASHEAMGVAKEAYARGKDELANSFRNYARELDRTIQVTADNKDAELLRWEAETRAMTAKVRKKK